MGPKSLLWPTLIVDSLVVGCLTPVLAASGFYAALRAATLGGRVFPRTPTADMPLLPIVELVVSGGPTLHPELTTKSLNLLLQSTDYDHVEVKGSRVPLRA